MNVASWFAAIGGPSALVGFLTWLVGTRGRRIDYAKVLQQMALDQSQQLDDRLEKADGKVTQLEARISTLNDQLEAALKRARLAEEESALRKSALVAANLPVPTVVA